MWLSNRAEETLARISIVSRAEQSRAAATHQLVLTRQEQLQLTFSYNCSTGTEQASHSATADAVWNESLRYENCLITPAQVSTYRAEHKGVGTLHLLLKLQVLRKLPTASSVRQTCLRL